jgi:HEAT repeat protein
MNVQEVKSFVDQMPDPDGKGMYTEDIDGNTICEALEAIYRGGATSLRQLIRMLDQPGTDADVKPHYALHNVVNLALIKGDEDKRRELCQTMAECLGSDHLSNYNKAFLCQTLQWAGSQESLPGLAALLLNEDLTEAATMALVAIEEGVVEPLLTALPRATGKSRLCIIDALAKLGDARANRALVDALDDEDPEVRMAAGYGLAKTGSAASAEPLIKAADVEPSWERIQGTKHCLVLAEQLAEQGDKPTARRIYLYLKRTRSQPAEGYVRDIADAALASLS